MGKAIDYALNQWPALLVFLEDGRLEIDNNLIENAIRPTAIGKNYVRCAVMRRGRRRSLWRAVEIMLARDRDAGEVRITTGSPGSA